MYIYHDTRRRSLDGVCGWWASQCALALGGCVYHLFVDLTWCYTSLVSRNPTLSRAKKNKRCTICLVLARRLGRDATSRCRACYPQRKQCNLQQHTPGFSVSSSIITGVERDGILKGACLSERASACDFTCRLVAMLIWPNEASGLSSTPSLELGSQMTSHVNPAYL